MATALRGGAFPGFAPALQGALGGRPGPGLIDAAGHAQTLVPITDAQAVGDIAEDVDPAGLAGNVRIDVVEGGMEAAVAVGGDEAQLTAGEAARGEGEEKGFPGAEALGAHEPEVQELAAAIGRHAVGHQGHAAAGAVRRFGAEADGVEEEIGPLIGEGPVVEGRDGLVQGAGDGGDGGGAEAILEQLGEERADLAGTDAAEEDTADQLIDPIGAALVAGEHGRGKAVDPSARDREGEGAPGGGEAPDVGAVAIAAAVGAAVVGGGFQIVGQFVFHAVFEETFHRAETFPRDVPPEGGFVLDLLPQIRYGEIGQCWHTGHGRILLPMRLWVEGTPSLFWRPLESPQRSVHYLTHVPRLTRLVAVL